MGIDRRYRLKTAQAVNDGDGVTVLFRDVTREYEHAAQLEFEASHDYLTGLANRRKCMEALKHAVAEAASLGFTQGASLAVLFIDLDHFKEVNDAFGRAVGNELLRRFAQGYLVSRPLDPEAFAQFMLRL